LMIAMKFDTQVIDMIQRTYNVRSYRLARPTSFTYKPGQFVFVTVESVQELVKKPLSISSSPTETEFIEFTKKFTDHPFSMALRAMKMGDHATIDGPYGNFTFEGEFERVGMMSGGVGITPLKGICKYCTDTLSKAKITLLYGNRTEEDIIFRREFEEMQKLNENLRVVFTVDDANIGWTGKVGMIDAGMVKNEIPEYLKTVFYVCGPPAMVDAMDRLLKSIGIPEGQIKRENFQGY
jgi:ferredoxin-NADP reductase